MPRKSTSPDIKKFSTGGAGRAKPKAQIKLAMTPLELAEKELNKLLMDARAWDSNLTQIRGTLTLY